MISTNIDGSSSGGANQLFDLLAVVSKPDVYAAKLKALQDAADKNQALINLVGPATEIMTMRSQIEADKAAAAIALAKAKEDADVIVANAKSTADSIANDAKEKADALVAETKLANADAKAVQAELKKSLADAKKAQSVADASFAASVEKQAALDAAIQSANNEKESFEALKAEIIAKQQKFISSL